MAVRIYPMRHIKLQHNSATWQAIAPVNAFDRKFSRQVIQKPESPWYFNFQHFYGVFLPWTIPAIQVQAWTGIIFEPFFSLNVGFVTCLLT